MLARARTGSGKTVAYCVPIVQKIVHGKVGKKDTSPYVRAVILVPTKELCDQVKDVIVALTRYCAKFVTVCSLGGDVSVVDQKYLAHFVL